MTPAELRADLECLKVWLQQHLLAHPPSEDQTWASYVDWQMDSIRHAVDHVITDHCEDADD